LSERPRGAIYAFFVGNAGLPIDYAPTKDIQVYSGLQNQTMSDRTKKRCPSLRRQQLLVGISAKGRGSSTFRRGRRATKTIWYRADLVEFARVAPVARR
jgi:hypothetical protein